MIRILLGYYQYPANASHKKEFLKVALAKARKRHPQVVELND